MSEELKMRPEDTERIDQLCTQFRQQLLVTYHLAYIQGLMDSEEAMKKSMKSHVEAANAV